MGLDLVNPISQVNHYIKPLKEITFKEGKVKFHYTTPREDLPGDFRLDKIEVIDLNGETLKSFVLGYEYSGNSTNYLNKRLVLTSITEVSQSGEYKPSYLFKYNSTDLPPRNSKSQDHWGYYNGASNGNSMIPSYTDAHGNLVKGANRSSSNDHMKAGVLEGIVYPTGGITTFKYEANRTVHSEPVIAKQTVFAENPEPVDGSTLCLQCNEVSTKSVTIEKLSGNVTLSPHIIRPENSLSSQETSVAIYRNGEEEPIAYLNESSTDQINTELENGTYTVEAKAMAPGSRVFLDIIYKTTDNKEVIKYLGGLRISEIKSIPKAGWSPNLIRKYSYDQGIVVDPLPVYATEKTRIYCEASDGGVSSCGNSQTCYYKVISASSVSSLGGNQGSPIAYSKVTEYYDVNGDKGKKEQHFTFKRDELIPNAPSNAVPTSNGWMRGHLLKETNYSYDKDSDLYVKASEIENEYVFLTDRDLHPQFYDAFSTSVWGYRSEMKSYYQNNSYVTGKGAKILYAFYNEFSSWYYQQSSTQRYYDFYGNTIGEITSTYDYKNPHNLQPTAITVTNSKGEVITTKNKFANDFGLTDLIAEHKVSLPVLTEKWINDEGIDYLLSASRFSYDGGQLGKQLLVGIDAILLDAPLTDYQGFSDNRFQNSKLYAYDKDGYITSIVNKLNDNIVSFKWNTVLGHPEAVVENSKPEAVFYESFENLPGNTDAKFGVKSSYITSGITLSLDGFLPDTDANYILSYWFKPVNGDWELKQVRWNDFHNANLTIQEPEGYIDEICLSPEYAVVKTYFFQPILGLVEQVDQNGHSMKYEYNQFQQLMNVYDQDRNILKNYKYNYYQKN